MKFNKWTLGLAALGVVSLASAARADEAKMSQVQTALSNTTLSGYVDVGATWRPGTDQGTLGGPNIPAYSYSKNDGFNLNAIDLALDKPEDEGPWDAGYHVELMVGPDNPLGVSSAAGGFLDGVNIIRQGYVTLRAPVGTHGIDFKIGVFDPIIGYESNSDPLNPNYTRSYGYTIEPVSHTGILATFKANDVLSLSAGVANTWSDALASVNGTTVVESQKTFMGSISLTAPDSFGAMKGATLTLGAVDGIDSNVGGTAGSKTSYFAGLTLPTPSSALKLGGAFDYLNADFNGGGDVWVAGLYATIAPTDKLSFNLRGELVDGTRLETATPQALVPFGNAAYAGHYAEEFTATMQYQIWANVLSRVEFRWDHVDGEIATPHAFGENNTKKNDFLLALNLIYQF